MKDYAIIPTSRGHRLMVGSVTLTEKLYFINGIAHPAKPRQFALPGGGYAELPEALTVARDLSERVKPEALYDQ